MTNRDGDLNPNDEGISLEVTDDRWCLMISTRSIVDGVLLGFLSLMLGVSIVFFLFLYFAEGMRSLLWVSLFVFALFVPVARLAAMRLVGKIVITIQRQHSSVFTGIGSLGWRQPFNWSETKWIQESHVVQPRADYYEITLSGTKQIRFGRLLSKDQRHSVLKTLRELKEPQQLGDPS